MDLTNVTTTDLLGEIAKRIDHAKDPTEPVAEAPPKLWTGKRTINGVDRQIGPGANLTRAYLSGANLYGAYLSGADLTRAYLYGANLSRANLYGAYLYEADLTRAILTGANLSGANLYGAILTGANLTRAILTGANLTRAYGNDYTVLPAGYSVKNGLIVRD